MFICYICGSSFESTNLLFQHFKILHYITSKNKYICKQDKCISEFQNDKAFRKHLIQQHSIRVKKDISAVDNLVSTIQTIERQSNSFPLLSAESNLTYSQHKTTVSDKDPVFTLTQIKNAMKSSAALFVAKLHNQTAVPRNVVQNCVDFTQEFFQCDVYDILKDKVFSVLNSGNFAQVDKDELEILFRLGKNPFEDLDTEYKRIQYFESTGYLIKPKSFIIGDAKTYKLIDGLKTEDTIAVEGQFISIKKVLQVFLSLPGFLNILKEYTEYLYNEIDPKYMCNIVHGKLWGEIKEKYKDRIVFPLSAYFDAYETNNPIGSHPGVDKLLAGYVMLLTLPPQFQSALKNIFLSLLFHDSDRKTFGNRACFKNLLREFIELEINGIKINNEKIYFCCILITGDSLGIHEVCGLIESFSANYPCRLCNVRKEVFPSQIVEDATLIRNVSEYDSDLAKNDSSETGLKERCIWNDMPSYHILINSYFDSMHDFWEGVCPYDLCPIILHYLKIKVFTLEDINDRILAFNYGPIDKGDALACISKEKLQRNKLGFSASETMTFVKYFGLIIGDCIPEDDEHWKLYLYLRSISELINLRFFDRNCVSLLRTLITEHHELYVKLFGNTLKPKHHFLLHYPRVIENIGPLRNLNCMRTEAKHKPSKVCAHVSNSRVNLSYTVALKHQLQQCYSFMCKDSLLHKIECGPSDLFRDEQISNICHLLPTDFNVNSEFHSVSWVSIENIKYTPSMVVTTGYENHLPTFAKIVEILLNTEKKCFFLVKKILTFGWSSHVCAFEVQEINKVQVISRDKLFNKFPTCVQNSGDGKYFVVYNDS